MKYEKLSAPKKNPSTEADGFSIFKGTAKN